MKKLFRCLRNFFAIVGVIATVLVIICVYAKPCFDVNISPNHLFMLGEYMDTLRASGPYVEDTSSCQIRIIQDTARAREIRDDFQLDTLYAPESDTWSKALAIGRFVASNIPHDNQWKWPESVNAIGLWEYTKTVAPAFNCRLHSLLSFELFLAAGIDAKYVTCMPEDSLDNDCHVVNEVWLPELGKWAMIDTDNGGNYLSDMNETPLSLIEIRESYLAGRKMMVHPGFGPGSSKKDSYYAYMVKNTYWFSCWGELSYYQEDYSVKDVIRDHYYMLVPSGFKPFRVGGGNTVTSDPVPFWAAPQH